MTGLGFHLGANIVHGGRIGIPLVLADSSIIISALIFVLVLFDNKVLFDDKENYIPKLQVMILPELSKLSIRI